MIVGAVIGAHGGVIPQYRIPNDATVDDIIQTLDDSPTTINRVFWTEEAFLKYGGNVDRPRGLLSSMKSEYVLVSGEEVASVLTGYNAITGSVILTTRADES